MKTIKVPSAIFEWSEVEVRKSWIKNKLLLNPVIVWGEAFMLLLLFFDKEPPSGFDTVWFRYFEIFFLLPHSKLFLSIHSFSFCEAIVIDGIHSHFRYKTEWEVFSPNEDFFKSIYVWSFLFRWSSIVGEFDPIWDFVAKWSRRELTISEETL